MALSVSMRQKVYERDNYRCRFCNYSMGLHPHHIKYKSAGGSDTLDNLITLCWICHRAVHDGFLKVNTSYNQHGELVIVAFQRREN